MHSKHTVVVIDVVVLVKIRQPTRHMEKMNMTPSFITVLLEAKLWQGVYVQACAPTASQLK